MSKLLPVRHPNRDFFIVDLQDAKPKDDTGSMEHPVFSLSVKPDMRELEYTTRDGRRLLVVPSGRGLATIMDKDILLYCVSKLVEMKNKGMEISPTVELNAHEVMVATNWRTSKTSYKRFEDALIRLAGTIIHTDIATGGEITGEGEGIIRKYKVRRKAPDGSPHPFGRLTKMEITLSDWMFRAVNAMEVLTINPQYFRLRRPLERRLYEIARKHVGTKNGAFSIGIERLREKVGTSAPLKKFRFNLKEIIRDGNVPDYGFMLDGDNVVMQRLIEVAEIPRKDKFIPLRPDTIDKAQKIAAQLRVSVWDLEQEWNEWAADKADEINLPDGAFLGFCKQKLGSRGAHAVVEAHESARGAQQLGLVLPEIGTVRGEE